MKTLALVLTALASGFWLGQDAGDEGGEPGLPTQEAFELDELVARGREAKRPWTPFLDRPTLSCGVYHLPAGTQDRQRPHELDEVYFVARGRARLTAGDEEFEARAGSIFFVAREVEHRFVDIEEDLTVVVFFPKGAAEDR